MAFQSLLFGQRHPHTQTLLQRAHDLAQFVDGARVHDPRSGANEPHRSNFVLWLGWVRANKRVVREAKQRRGVGGRLKVAKHELCRACGRCTSWDVRARDGPREVVKHVRGVCTVSSTRARQTWSVASHASRSSEPISQPFLSLSYMRTRLAHLLKGKREGRRTRMVHEEYGGLFPSLRKRPPPL